MAPPAASRAHLPGARAGAGLAALSDLLADIAARFDGAGARPVEPATLQPADLLLDLYGEDIRARAFVTEDPVDGALMLRPDFTVPVLRLHLTEGQGAPARWRYAGPVWRRQAPGSERPTEYLQAGLEILGEPDAAPTDAELFALIEGAVAEALGRPPEVATGDLAIALAAIRGLTAPERWRAALRRHLWRPAAFRAALGRFGPDRPAPSADRVALMAAAAEGRVAEIVGEAPGLRSVAEIATRLRDLAEEAAADPIPAEEIAALEALLAVAGPSAQALERMRGLGAEIGGGIAAELAPALDRFEARLEALAARGADAGALPFDASFGRSLEYYDGFVFEISAPGGASGPAAGLPPLAGGGRYDALAARLAAADPEAAGAQGLSAVGAIVRPEALRAAALAGQPRAAAAPAAPRAAPAADTLRLALPSKGRLRDAAAAWLADRGVTVRPAGEREYAGAVEGVAGVELLLLSAGEIPRELAAGRVHLGVTGEDLVRERIPGWDRRVLKLADLGFGHADLIVAAPEAWADVEGLADLDAVAGRFRAAHGMPLRIATKYHVLARRFLRDRGVGDYRLVDSQGATEGVVRNGAAEAIVDITTSGETLRANRLKPLADGLVLRSQAGLWRSLQAPQGPAATAALAELTLRLGLAGESSGGAGQGPEGDAAAASRVETGSAAR